MRVAAYPSTAARQEDEEDAHVRRLLEVVADDRQVGHGGHDGA